MRVTFVLPYAGLSGGTRVVSIYARRLMERGHEVHVASVPLSPERWQNRLRRWLQRAEAPPVSGSFFDALPGVLHVLDRNRPVEDRDVPEADVIVATWWETAEWVWRMSPSKGAKAYFVQGHEVFPYLPVHRVEATLRLPMHKIVVAPWLAEVMRTRYGDAAAMTVENSVDHSLFHAPPRGKQSRPTIGTQYSSTGVKGFADAAAAIRRLKRSLPSLCIRIFGAERPRRDLPLPDGAEFLLAPRQDELREIYGTLDAWLSAGHSEGFGLPVLEAMACRTPVISTRTGIGPKVITPGHNGYLADVGDVNALAEHAQRVLTSDDAAWRRMSEAAWQRVQEYTWDDATALMEKALETAVERAARGEIAGGVGAAAR